ncbi:MAG: DUF512 domain-containing protein [Thermodesulfovibrionales bacterium]
MYKNTGAEIVDVRPDSPAFNAGITAGDVIVSINGHSVNDIIDFMFYSDGNDLDMVVRRKNKRLSFKLHIKEGQDIGVEIRPFKIRTCTNRCIFCFVNQLPRGLRKTLYIKDEDYRMSFLYGNFITLTNLTPEDKKRIVKQRLSPLYISIHSTNRAIRNSILGNPNASDVLKEVKFFKDSKIKMHCQVVLCPGLNDGKELQRTIRDLYRFYPYVSSIAVVPVGLTAHRRPNPSLSPVEKEDAIRAIELIDAFQKRFKKKHGDPIVYGADELYIKAEVPFLPLREYGELPQIENGVGMVPLFISQAKLAIARKLRAKAHNRFITFTGISFYPYLKKFTDRFVEKEGIDITVIPLENSFFGKSVTVTGLLTGRDVIRTLSGKIEVHEDSSKEPILLIPDSVLRAGDGIFLDDISPRDVEETLGIKARVIEATPVGLINGLEASA